MQWLKFASGLWWIFLFLQVFAAAGTWIREGTALTLPLFAFRNTKLIQSMRFCLPCAIAAALWDPPMINASSTSTSSGGRVFTKRWLNHAVVFTVIQHVPMFIGAHFYLDVVADGSSDVRAALDDVLYKPIAEIARQAAVVGVMSSATWCGVDFVWPKLRANNEARFEPLV